MSVMVGNLMFGNISGIVRLLFRLHTKENCKKIVYGLDPILTRVSTPNTFRLMIKINFKGFFFRPQPQKLKFLKFR